MKTALIPPIPELGRFGRGDFHLVLSHLVSESVEYTNHYAKERDRGAYIVLDNSAHENTHGEAADALMRQALALRANEVVVPDVLFDAAGTVEAGTDAMETWFEGDSKDATTLNPAFMYVPQGRNTEEWAGCLDELIQIHRYAFRKYKTRSDLVIGISKDYEVWDGGVFKLMDRYVVPAREKLLMHGFKTHIHMLGWGRQLWNLSSIAHAYPWIRSTDSAKPFVYALNEIVLAKNAKGIPPKYPTRSDNYFASKMTRAQADVAAHNVAVFKREAAGG